MRASVTVTMPRRGSLICISMAAETICRMRTASLRARAGSAMDPPRDGARRGARTDRGTAGAAPVGVRLAVLVGEQLPVRRQQRHLRPVSQQPLARVEDVGH